jgi:hypothetical protein
MAFLASGWSMGLLFRRAPVARCALPVGPGWSPTGAAAAVPMEWPAAKAGVGPTRSGPGEASAPDAPEQVRNAWGDAAALCRHRRPTAASGAQVCCEAFLQLWKQGPPAQTLPPALQIRVLEFLRRAPRVPAAGDVRAARDGTAARDERVAPGAPDELVELVELDELVAPDALAGQDETARGAPAGCDAQRQTGPVLREQPVPMEYARPGRAALGALPAHAVVALPQPPAQPRRRRYPLDDAWPHPLRLVLFAG